VLGELVEAVGLLVTVVGAVLDDVFIGLLRVDLEAFGNLDDAFGAECAFRIW